MAQPVFFDLIGASPFDALRQHMQLALQCSNTLPSFVDAMLAEQWTDIDRMCDTIRQLEAQADDLKRNIRLSLHKGLFLPVPRVEILGLIKEQDRIPNLIQDFTIMVVERKLVLPQTVHESFKVFVVQAVQTCRYAHEAIEELSVFFDSGFSGNVSDLLENMLSKVAQMEHVADTGAVSVRRELFKLEPTLSAIHVIFLYEIVRLVSALADAAESISDRLLLILAHD